MRLVRHLSFSNVIAVIALFIALGGAAYAGTKINGKTIINKSIGGGKLKNETITANKIKKGTITSAQIAPGSIDSTQINIQTLTTVPSATTANTATTATTATTAKTAETATKATSAITADTADEADEAKEAESAKHAKEADNAKHADEADVATTATNATHATEADHAEDAGTLEGTTVSQILGASKVDCSHTAKATEPYGGMCWETTVRPINFWVVAVKTCGNAGGRLPLIGELIAYLTHDGNTPGSEAQWSGSLLGSEQVLTTDDNENVGESGPAELGYRCVYPLSN